MTVEIYFRDRSASDTHVDVDMTYSEGRMFAVHFEDNTRLLFPLEGIYYVTETER